MRISDWSSDVCSSDLVALPLQGVLARLEVVHVLDRVEHVVARQRAQVGAGVAARDPELGRDLGHVHADPALRDGQLVVLGRARQRSEEHTSELPSLMRISYAVFCLKKTKHHNKINTEE